jgi:hypothetical protein
MQAVVSKDYQLYRRWFERSLDLIWQMPPEMRAKADPMAEIAKAEAASMAQAVRSVAAGVTDTVGMTDRLPKEEVARLDALFERDGLPSLSSMQALFSKKVRKILKLGKLQSEEDYYTLKALEDADLPDATKAEIQSLVGDYELRLLSS